MKKAFFIILIMLTGHTIIFSQVERPNESFYIYPEFRKAIANKTRSLKGTPGEKYWQNRSKYKISVSINTATRKITGYEKVQYFNNSPDSLETLVIRTYPDFYKCTNVKDYTVDKSDCSDGMNISSIKFDNDSSGNFSRAGTNVYLSLPKKLAPHQSITVNIAWDYFLPGITKIREGTYYESSYFVAYWYPQVSVYDDYNGWDYFNYTGLQEFYNDFNDYDVTIEAPASYMVWATGDWKNPSDVLTEPYLSRYYAGQTSDSAIHIIDSNSRKNGAITKSANSNKYHFTADSVCDFTFAASDTYLWDMISAERGNKGQKTAVSLVYYPGLPQFSNLALPAKRVIKYLSESWPGIEFPCPQVTIFSGESGMEYAMMINQSYIYDEQGAEVMAHELVHMYVPFLVATNERKYAWMDEALAQTLPNDCEIEVNHKKFKPQQVTKYLISYVNGFIGTAMESPPMELSINQKGGTYYFSAYTRPMLALIYLREIIGDSLYKKAIREFIARWKFKHPSPYDFFFTFNDVCNRNLNWFWKTWFFDHAFPDISITGVTVANNNAALNIRQIGTLPVPLQIICRFKDGSSINVNRSAGIWEKASQAKINIPIPAGKKLDKIEVNMEMAPDIDLSNNVFSVK